MERTDKLYGMDAAEREGERNKEWIRRRRGRG
jgi:hypothetical protein